MCCLQQARADTIDLQTDTSLLVDISDALSEHEKVKFTVHTKVGAGVCIEYVYAHKFVYMYVSPCLYVLVIVNVHNCTCSTRYTILQLGVAEVRGQPGGCGFSL